MIYIYAVSVIGHLTFLIAPYIGYSADSSTPDESRSELVYKAGSLPLLTRRPDSKNISTTTVNLRYRKTQQF